MEGFLGDASNARYLPGQEKQRRGFDPWVGKIPWRRAWQPIPVFLPGEHSSLWTEEPGELHGARGIHGVAKGQT